MESLSDVDINELEDEEVVEKIDLGKKSSQGI